MQIKSLRIKSYRSWRVDESVNANIAAFREEKIKNFEKLRKEGCSENKIFLRSGCAVRCPVRNRSVVRGNAESAEHYSAADGRPKLSVDGLLWQSAGQDAEPRQTRRRRRGFRPCVRHHCHLHGKQGQCDDRPV